MCSELKKEVLIGAAQEIVKYLETQHEIDVDVYHIVELLNIEIGFLFDFVGDNVVYGVKGDE